MKPNHLFTSMLAVTALFVASCSTSKLAQNSAIQDDVYNTTAQAKEYKEIAPPQVTAQNDTQTDDYYGTNDPYYDMDYATRINRFYYANPWRTYYDGYYGYNSYLFSPFYNSYAFGFGMGMYGGLNSWISPYSYWGYYGSPYYGNYWGLYSYNNPYYYGGGYGLGGGYYGSIGGRGHNNANYGPRPSRGSENGLNRGNGTSYNGNPNGAISRTSSSGGSRAERYNPSNGTTSSTRTNGTTSSTPTSRTSSGSDSRPTRSNDSPPPARTYSPPQQSSPPPSSSSSGSSSRGSGSSSSSSSGGGRPTRGGGR